MKRFLVLMVAVTVAALAVVPAAWAGDVQGKIKSVDQTGRVLTLDDGTQLVIPASVQVNRKDLMPGADVKAAFQEQGSQKVVTSIEVKPPAK